MGLLRFAGRFMRGAPKVTQSAAHNVRIGKQYPAQDIAKNVGKVGNPFGSIARNVLGYGSLGAGVIIPSAFAIEEKFDKGSTLDAILNRPKEGGKFDIGFMGDRYGFTQDYLEGEEATRLIKGNSNISEAVSRGIIDEDDVKGKSQTQIEAEIRGPLRTARVKEKASDPGGVNDMQALLQLNMQRDYNLAVRDANERFEIRRDTLQEKVDSREGQQGLLELQLLQNKDQFNRELEYKREKDSADRRQDLIQSIQALGMAFAL